MSWQAFQAVRDYSKVTDNTGRLIMFTIASYCNEHGNMDNANITPSYQTLANGAACHKQTVKNWLKKLVKSGELSYTTEKIKGSNIKLMTRFTINLPMSDTCLEFDENIENEPQTKLDLLQRIEHLENELNAVLVLLKKVEENEEVSTSRVHCEYIHECTHKDNKDNKGEQSPNGETPPLSLDNKTNTNEQPKLETKEQQLPSVGKKDKQLVIPDELNNEQFITLFNEFVEHRKQIKKKMSELAKKKFIHKCMKAFDKHGIDWVIFELERSIINGWQDVYFKDNSPFFHNNQYKNNHVNGHSKPVIPTDRITTDAYGFPLKTYRGQNNDQ